MNDLSGFSVLPRLRVVLAGLAMVALTAPASAAPAAKDGRTEAPIAFLYDLTSDAVLFAKQPDLPSPPASMATLMTTELTFRALEAGSLKETDTFRISEDAWRRGGAPSRGSAMFAKLNSQVAVSDLLRGMIVQSGGDAAITLAAGIAGSEPAFADLMNARAQELGLARSRFRNATGLPDPEQVMTARDISRLAAHLIRAYPERYALFAEPEFTWNKIAQRNRNPLLSDYPGADGLKTGYTADSGYGLVGSARRDGRRLIVVLNGLESSKARAEEARKLLDWGFSAFETKRLFDAGETVAEARVFGGATRHVPLAADAAVDVLTPKNDDARVIARVVYDGPLTAPVRKGDRIGVLRVWRGEMLTVETPLRAAEDVGEGGLGRRAVDGAMELVGDWIHQVVARI
ncbi:D-alanyl-D-alanine carboxypeptidase [Methylopila jiangsuensis]|uniref:serine-type D-Ala-D-Ala carboxypeptidase n=1 Tax=Methylopila jiangsuensis TaxID=586230 RepID=A0A9W6JFQ2_9HYPH|nr:D-alanyl-D-alanine carboxypeptidase family protein [Methylopila jiangsuensis]MDR6285833.1 D-alanyl-D-alanine carboxypeptidase (penicillin-binding protein 5/6) [Methylopila jiangsuensis]GLK75591.1 D-alanyl-D-alanine carboxypeptidase [Methylopila jiangsuensis]